MKTLSALLYRIASWKTLALAVLLYIPFAAYFFPNLQANMAELAGRPIGPIDLLIGYKPGEIEDLLAAYGPAGRAVYAQGEMTIDVAYPFVYTFLFCIILSLLYRGRPYAPFGKLTNVVPVAVMVADLLENACIVTLLNSYPATSGTVVLLCTIFLNLKWAATLLTLALLFYGLLRLFIAPRPRLT